MDLRERIVKSIAPALNPARAVVKEAKGRGKCFTVCVITPSFKTGVKRQTGREGL